jgi:hypothetical protein
MVGLNQTHLGFRVGRAALEPGILIPKYYDPELALAVEMAGTEFDVPELRDLLLPGDAGSQLGVYMPREFYGTGDVPFVRTSYLSHWRIRPDYKKGVSREVYASFGERNEATEGDLLMVAHGTYLVGNVAVVTAADVPLVLQDHVFRLRVSTSAAVSNLVVLAALSTAFVQRQVRSRQFSAEIIDKLGERHLGIRVPLPHCQERRAAIAARVRAVLREQAATLAAMRDATGSDLRMTRERAPFNPGFMIERGRVQNRILLPKYYDPALDQDLRDRERREGTPWISVRSLVESGLLDITTGVEVGKMAYGMGRVPFIRTSDLIAWEVNRVTKQGISEEIYEAYPDAALKPYDILLVRDGTYLVGSSAMVMPNDVPALCSGGLYRLRSRDTDRLDPHVLLAALNQPLVRRQMRAKQFTRDVLTRWAQDYWRYEFPKFATRMDRLLARGSEGSCSRKPQ